MKKVWILVLLMALFAPLKLLAADSPKASVSGYILFHYEYYASQDGQYKIAKNADGPADDFTREASSGFDAFRITRTYVHFKLQADGQDENPAHPGQQPG